MLVAVQMTIPKPLPAACLKRQGSNWQWLPPFSRTYKRAVTSEPGTGVMLYNRLEQTADVLLLGEAGVLYYHVQRGHAVDT